MPLNLFYTMVQKSQKWPKSQIKGGPALNVEKKKFREALEMSIDYQKQARRAVRRTCICVLFFFNRMWMYQAQTFCTTKLKIHFKEASQTKSITSERRREDCTLQENRECCCELCTTDLPRADQCTHIKRSLTSPKESDFCQFHVLFNLAPRLWYPPWLVYESRMAFPN